MAEGFSHIRSTANPRKTLCGATYRKPIMDRPQVCPQCARVEKRIK